jgi:hypothetical protein
MTSGTDPAVAEVWDDWQSAVTMTAGQLEDWLETEESRSVGDRGGSGEESTGHASGRRRHLAQRPSGDVSDTRWRYSLMNWGHDPLG